MAAAPLDQWSDGGSDSDWDWSDEEENDSPFDAAMRDHHQFIIRAVHLGLIDLASDRFPKSTLKNVLDSDMYIQMEPEAVNLGADQAVACLSASTTLLRGMPDFCDPKPRCSAQKMRK